MPRFALDEIVQATGAAVTGGAGTIFADVTTDTRTIEKGALFIALKGERFNGEDFLRKAQEAGAAGVIVSNGCPAEKTDGLSIAVLRAADTLKAYQQIAHAWRDKFSLPVVAITGSNGKTTTKDLTASVLGASFPVLRTEANFNNEIGLPKTLLGLRDEHKAAVVEIGMRGLGQIEALAPIAAPTVGVVTNVGETHIELLGSIENIAKAKSEMVEALGEGGTAVLNADDSRVLAMRGKAKKGVAVVTFGENENADVRGTEIVQDGMESHFNVMFPDGKKQSCRLPLPGRHNVSNALAALAVGYVLGLSPEAMASGLEAPAMSGARFACEKRGDVMIINDAYNASPLSMSAAIRTMKEIAKGRRVAVLGDMLELGDVAKEAHRRVGEELAKSGAAALVTRGTLGEEIAAGAEKAGMTEVYRCASHEEAAATLKKILRPGDTLLFKGSHGMQMDKIIGLL
ncbi:MAG: UDP-N-acetylmuramoyl-tripeptide--D-alanyl-D-alanine ligase [Schwartzia sp.]|nr:UDP-N-acetylmuramoyl-tripeptide--D-alanyl-D-alanine ligase [Schwartzia sp. (in: firmicutes)]